MRTYASREKKPTSQALPKPKSVVKPLSIEGSPIQAKSNQEGLAEWEAQRQKWARFGSPWMDKVPNPSGELAQPWIQRQQQFGTITDPYKSAPQQGIFQKIDAAQLQPDNLHKENRTGMPEQLKSGLEQMSGFDLSDVRVHRNSVKPAQLNALAYAQGQNIYLAPGQERQLPHEGWHVIQQMQGRVKPTMQLRGVDINNDSALEQEADQMGGKAKGGGEGALQFANTPSNALAQLKFQKKVTTSPSNNQWNVFQVMAANGLQAKTTAPLQVMAHTSARPH